MQYVDTCGVMRAAYEVKVPKEMQCIHAYGVESAGQLIKCIQVCVETGPNIIFGILL